MNSSARWRKLTVAWHGGGRRDIKVIRRVSRWYRQGHRLVTIRWVDVRDLTGTLRDECLMATDDGLSEAQIVENDVGRWDIEVMYEEMREHLGLEKNRGRSMQTVVRVEPCLFCPYSLIVLRFASLPGDPLQRLLIRWPGKTSITFSDAIATVRRQTWTIYINETTILGSAVEKLTRSQRQSLLDAPALAA